MYSKRHIIMTYFLCFSFLLIGFLDLIVGQSDISFKTKISQGIVLGISTTHGYPRSVSYFKSSPLGGYYFFGQQKRDAAFFTATIGQLPSSNIQYFIGIDHEGGHIQRISNNGFLPNLRYLSEFNDCILTHLVGYETGRNLHSLGFNVTFSPVIDIMHTDSDVLSFRTFGTQSDTVSRQGTCYAKGVERSGTLPVGKHFPGHGLVHEDTHHELAKGSIDSLTLHLAPFKSVISADIPMIMVSHLLLPELDAKHPASTSHKILTGLLRQSMKFKGLILSDDIAMVAANPEKLPLHAVIKRAFMAGTNIILSSHSFGDINQAITLLAKDNDPEFEKAIHHNYEKIKHFKQTHLAVKSSNTKSNLLSSISDHMNAAYSHQLLTSIPTPLKPPLHIYSDDPQDRYRLPRPFRTLFSTSPHWSSQKENSWFIIHNRSSLNRLSPSPAVPALLILMSDPDHFHDTPLPSKYHTLVIPSPDPAILRDFFKLLETI